MNDKRSQNLNTTPVSFGAKLADSDSFKALFRDGMSLVEEAADYLDGDGRAEAKSLPRVASLAYAPESMRLTTRLMQMASWLLLQRAVNEGEMSLEQAGQEKNKVRLHGLTTPKDGPGWDELPLRLRALIEQSLHLQKRIRHLDEVIYSKRSLEPEESVEQANPVGDQIGLIANAFAAKTAEQ
jgi:regulator of CtrA degradation